MIASPPLMRYINQKQFTNIGDDLILVDTPQGTASDPQSITFTCAPPNCTPHSPGRSHHCSHPHFCTPTEIQTSSFNLHATASNFQRKLHARHTTHTTLSIAVGHARTMNGMCGSRLHQARSENRTSTCMQQHQTCKLQQKLHARRTTYTTTLLMLLAVVLEAWRLGC